MSLVLVSCSFGQICQHNKQEEALVYMFTETGVFTASQ